MDLGASKTPRTVLTFPGPLAIRDCHNYVLVRGRGMLLFLKRGKRYQHLSIYVVQDLAIDIRMLLLAFVDHSTTPGGPTAYFNNPGNNPALYVSAVIFAFLTLLGDGFMVILSLSLIHLSRLTRWSS